MNWIHPRIPVFIIILLGFGGCSKKSSPGADAIDAFVSGGFDSLTIHALDPVVRDQDNDESDEDYEAFLAEVTPDFFHGFPILRSAPVSDSAKALETVQAVTKSMRRAASGYKCFNPRHGVRITKEGDHLDLVICYQCEFVQRWDKSGEHQLETIATTSQAKLDALLANP